MSQLKPPMKQARAADQTAVTRTESVAILQDSVEEERNRRIGSALPLTAKTDANAHPKGHRVKTCSEVWKSMDSQSFLHLGDTNTLSDVWVMPIAVEPSSSLYVTVTFLEIILAYHVKYREATSKMSTDDLLKILYLNDCLQWDMQGVMRLGYDEWIAEKTASFIKRHGVDDSTNRGKLCHFIVAEDKEFTFYPSFLKSVNGVFFRKVCVHTYRDTDGEMKKAKISNPSMVKCCASRGKFEYIYEARLIPLPDNWFTDRAPSEKEIPESQELV